MQWIRALIFNTDFLSKTERNKQWVNYPDQNSRGNFPSPKIFKVEEIPSFSTWV